MNEEKTIYSSMEHKDFFVRSLKRCRYQDVYHAALVYCLGIDRDTRDHVNEIYDFKTGLVKTECLHEFSLHSYSLFSFSFFEGNDVVFNNLSKLR